VSEAPRDERECPWCAELILARARVCKHCGRDVTPLERLDRVPNSKEGSGPADLHPPPLANANSASAEMAPPSERDASAAPIDAAAPDAVSNTNDHSSEPTLRNLIKEGFAEGTPEKIDEKLIGVGGWLAWFVLGQIGTACIGIYEVYSSMSTLGAQQSALRVVDAGLVVDSYIDGLCAGAFAVGAIVGLYLMARKSILTPRFFCFFLGIAAVLAVVEFAVLVDISDRLTRLQRNTVTDSDITGQLRGVLYGVVWMFYWMRSKRVKANYGYSGFRIPSLVLTRRTFAERKAASAMLRRALAWTTVGVLVVAVVVFMSAAGSTAPVTSQSVSSPTQSPLATQSGGQSVAASPAAPAPPISPKADPFASQFRGAGVNADSLYAAHKDDWAIWSRNATAMAVVTHLHPSEQRELARVRSDLLKLAPVVECAGWVRGRPLSDQTLARMDSADRRKANELSQLALVRAVATPSAADTSRIGDDRAGAILRKYSTPSELVQIGKSDSTATDEDACQSGVRIFTVLLRIPGETKDSRDGIRWILDAYSGRKR
jgi:hypothetical protein